LIESRNAGTSWRPISMRGDVDFHVLEAQRDTVYGFGSDWKTREPNSCAATTEAAPGGGTRLCGRLPMNVLGSVTARPRHTSTGR
jgi:hypothetical protein